MPLGVWLFGALSQPPGVTAIVVPAPPVLREGEIILPEHERNEGNPNLHARLTSCLLTYGAETTFTKPRP